MTLHERLARIARDELKNAYASREDAAEAMAAAIIDGLVGAHAIVELADTPAPLAGNPQSRAWLRGWLSCLYAHGITPSPEILEATR